MIIFSFPSISIEHPAQVFVFVKKNKKLPNVLHKYLGADHKGQARFNIIFNVTINLYLYPSMLDNVPGVSRGK